MASDRLEGVYRLYALLDNRGALGGRRPGHSVGDVPVGPPLTLAERPRTRPDRPGAAVGEGTSEGYYEEVGEGQVMSFNKAADLSQELSWGLDRGYADLRRSPFHALGRIDLRWRRRELQSPDPVDAADMPPILNGL